MGKDKDTPKKVLLPSTTRRGTDLLTRPHHSPAAVGTTVPKNSSTILPSSPLARMSTATTENAILGESLDNEGPPNLSGLLTNAIDFVTTEIDMDTSSSSRESISPQDLALNTSFLDFDMDNLEESDARMRLALAGLLPASYNEYEPAIYIKDDDYNFSVDTEIIKNG